MKKSHLSIIFGMLGLWLSSAQACLDAQTGDINPFFVLSKPDQSKSVHRRNAEAVKPSLNRAIPKATAETIDQLSILGQQCPGAPEINKDVRAAFKLLGRQHVESHNTAIQQLALYGEFDVPKMVQIWADGGVGYYWFSRARYFTEDNLNKRILSFVGHLSKSEREFTIFIDSPCPPVPEDVTEAASKLPFPLSDYGLQTLWASNLQTRYHQQLIIDGVQLEGLKEGDRGYGRRVNNYTHLLH